MRRRRGAPRGVSCMNGLVQQADHRMLAAAIEVVSNVAVSAWFRRGRFERLRLTRVDTLALGPISSGRHVNAGDPNNHGLSRP